MILIDAIFINGGGGKILLDYLLEDFFRDVQNEKISLLIDNRIKSEYEGKFAVKTIFINSFSERNLYYRNNKTKFSKVLCFGNIPPNIRLNALVFTYFHQSMYLYIPIEFGFIERQKFKIKVLILKYFEKNTDFWIVQNDFIEKGLIRKLKINPSKILKIPFYPPFKDTKVYHREPHSFIFVSNATPHKNHIKLINAFCKFYDMHKVGTLTLTVSDDFYEVANYIREKQLQDYPIKNIGYVVREDLYQYYQKSQYLVFPSLTESFGLGIVEAIENGCKVIAADLPYIYEVCRPSLTFNPNDENSIFESFSKAIDSELPNSEKHIYNKIKDLKKLLTENENQR